jgi:hypothetical protein
MDQNLTNGLTSDGVKVTTSDIYIALFHQSKMRVDEADVVVWGPFQDQYGNTSYEVAYGTKLTRAVAQHINWNADQSTLELDIIPGLWETVTNRLPT